MATEKKYYIGTGNGAAAPLDANGEPTRFTDLGEMPVFEITETIEWAENKATDRTGPNMLDMRVPISREMDVKLTVKEHTKRNLELIHHSAAETIPAGSVTDEELPDGFEVGDMYFPKKSNVDVDTIVLTDEAGTPNVLAAGTHYRVGESGAITFLNVDDADAVKALGNIHLVSQPNADDTLVVGSKTYTFKVTATTNLHIQIGVDKETTATNIANRINLDTADTLCTAVAAPADVALTANTGGTAGNSIALTVDGTRLTRTAFAGGEAADALTQPFHLAYDYGESTEVAILSDDPEAICLVLDGKNLTPSPDKNLFARIDNIRLSAATVPLKSGSSAGTGNTVNEYELTGKAQLKPGNTAEDGYGVIRQW
jgi:hypothetical protein